MILVILCHLIWFATWYVSEVRPSATSSGSVPEFQVATIRFPFHDRFLIDALFLRIHFVFYCIDALPLLKKPLAATE